MNATRGDSASAITQVATFAIPGTGARRVRLQVQGTAVRARVWQASLAEPTAWSASVTDTAITAPSVVVALIRTAGTNSVAVDDFRLTRPGVALAAFATYTYNNDSQYTAETMPAASRAWTYTTGRLTTYSQTLSGATTATEVAYVTNARGGADA